MESNLYQAYCRNPALRDELERHARALRAAEMDRLLFTPLANSVRGLFTRRAGPAARRMTPHHQFHA